MEPVGLANTRIWTQDYAQKSPRSLFHASRLDHVVLLEHLQYIPLSCYMLPCTTKGSDKISISLMGNSYYSLIHFTSLSMTASRFPRPLTSSPNTIQCMYVLSWYIVQHWSIINHNGCCVGMSYRESDQRFFIFLLEKKTLQSQHAMSMIAMSYGSRNGVGYFIV